MALALFSLVLAGIIKNYSGQLKKIYAYQHEQQIAFTLNRVLTKAIEQLYLDPSVYQQQLIYGGVLPIEDALFQDPAFQQAYIKVDPISHKGSLHLIQLSIVNVDKAIYKGSLPDLMLTFEVHQ